MEVSSDAQNAKEIPVAIELDGVRTEDRIWLWRNLWRRMLPPGLIIFPFQNYPTLVYFWRTGSGAASLWVYLSWMLTAALGGLDLWTYLFAPVGAAQGPVYYGLAELRFLALPIYMLLIALAVVARCRWWKHGDRINELLLTFLEGRDILPLLWVPPAWRVMGVYGMGFTLHVLLAGQWHILLRDGLGVWFYLAAPKNLMLAMLEFLTALMVMRAAVTCALFSAVKSASPVGITFRALRSAIEYILLALAGSFLYLFILATLGLIAFALGLQLLQWFAVLLAVLMVMSLLRHLTMDTLEDYQDFLRDWRKWIV